MTFNFARNMALLSLTALLGLAQTLPNPELTPGAIDSKVTQQTIHKTVCTSGYTKTVRNVPVRIKRQVAESYGLNWPLPRGAYEIDHWISLEIGGKNDVTNLWPQPLHPKNHDPGFRQKDVVENYLHRQVCKGAIGLREAQEQIADWPAVYQKIKARQ